LEVVWELRRASKEHGSGEDQCFLSPPDREEVLLETIEKERTSLENASAYLLEEEIERSEEVASASSLPPPHYLERILRYQAAHDRRFYRAMEKLERLQQQRKAPAA
jgi:hypothetical protein